MDRRYVYILQRTGQKECVILLALPVMDATYVETTMHHVFSDSGIKDITKTPYPRWWELQSHIKIGIATSPMDRLENINESGLKSGKTEWFRATWLEIMFMMIWLIWFFIRPAFWLIVACGLIWWYISLN